MRDTPHLTPDFAVSCLRLTAERRTMTIRATKVFTPGAFPEHTYVERQGAHLERNLRDALDTSGMIVALAGPSRSGKTVLVEKVVGQQELITIQGTGINVLKTCGTMCWIGWTLLRNVTRGRRIPAS